MKARWLWSHYMLVLWHERVVVQGFFPKPTFMGMIKTTIIASRDVSGIKERQRLKKDRKDQSFPSFPFFPPVSKPLSAEQKVQSCSFSELVSAVLFLKTDLSTEKRRACTSEVLRGWAQRINISPHSFTISLLPLYKKAIGRSGSCSCTWAACRCVGALDSDVPSTPIKAREKRKAECWGENENLLFSLLLLSRVTAGKENGHNFYH